MTPDPISVARWLAIFSEVRPGAVETTDRRGALRIIRRPSTTGARTVREHDAFVSAYRVAVGRDNLMTHFPQLRSHQLIQLRLHLQLVAHLVVAEARLVPCRLHVGAKIENVGEDLHVALALLIATGLTGDGQRPAVAHEEPRR